MAKTVRELQEEAAAKRSQVADMFAAKKTASGEYDLTRDEVEQIRALNRELNALNEQAEELGELEEIRRGVAVAADDGGRKAGTGRRGELVPNGDGRAAGPTRPGSIKGLLAAHAGYLAFQSGRVKAFQFDLSEIELKTLLTLGDITPQAAHQAAPVPSAQAFQDVADLFAQGTINTNAYEYYEETTFTNAAAETAEGTAKPEAALDFTLRTETMRKIAVWIPATSEVLMDNDALESYIRGRLTFMVIQRRAGQLLHGDGIAPNLLGVSNRTGVQTQAKGSDPTFDAILKAMTKVRVTGDAEPTGVVMHPNDWQDLVLTRTADGLYILGNPSDPAVGQRIWGIPVRVTPQQTENTAVVGAFNPMAQIFRKPGSAITITVSTEHASYFVENKVAILAEERILLACYRGLAFALVTGI